MASCANSDDELASRLSQLSPDGVDEQHPQLPLRISAPASDVSRPTTPHSDEDGLALALTAFRLSQLSSDGFDEQVSRLRYTGSPPASGFSTPPDEADENDLSLALNLSQLLADIFDEQVNELNRRRESSPAFGGGLASLFMTMSPAEVRTTPPIYLCNH